MRTHCPVDFRTRRLRIANARPTSNGFFTTKVGKARRDEVGRVKCGGWRVNEIGDCLSASMPQRGNTIEAPGNARGNGRGAFLRPEGARQRDASCVALSGRGILASQNPGRCPGLKSCRPVGAKSNARCACSTFDSRSRRARTVCQLASSLCPSDARRIIYHEDHEGHEGMKWEGTKGEG